MIPSLNNKHVKLPANKANIKIQQRKTVNKIKCFHFGLLDWNFHAL